MSLIETIPDRPLVMPAGAHAARADAQKMFGLKKYTCAYCKKTFYRRLGETEYIRYKGGKKLHFCTWTHTCRWEKKNPEREKVPKKGRKRKPAQERIDKLIHDIAKIRTVLDSEAGMAMSREDRNRMRSRIGWRAHEMRKLMEGMDNEGPGGVRGIAGGDDRAEICAEFE